MVTDEQRRTWLRCSELAQIAAGAWDYDTTVSAAAKTWSWLRQLPRATSEVELSALRSITLRIAIGFLKVAESSVEGRRGAEAAILLIIRKHTDATLDLGRISATLRISRYHLSRLINIESGWSFRMHLHGTRVLHACALLPIGDFSVKGVAAKVGYERTSDLDRHFSDLLRVKPSAFRTHLIATDSRWSVRPKIEHYIREHPNARPAEIADTLRLPLSTIVAFAWNRRH